MDRPVRLSLAAWILLLASISSALADTAKPIGNDTEQKQWQEGLTLLGTGQIDRASKLIHDVANTAATDKRVRRVDTWVGGFEKLQADRTGRIKGDYEKYVGWVKEDTEKGFWRRAIKECGMAFNCAADPDAFRKEPWLTKTVEGALKAAEKYEKASKWISAAIIYVRLTEIFPLNKTYSEALDRCQAHIRLDFTYTPDSDWQASVSDILPEMARDAFRKINTEYLKEPVFKDAVVAGLKQVLRLANEPKVKKEFSSLSNASAKKEFCVRVEAKLEYAEESEKLTVKNLIEYFDNVLKINEETELFPQNVLIYEFVQGALQPLDRFSDMIWPADLQEFNKHTQGRFSGVGISIKKDPGEPIKVMSPLEDTPAYRAGIQPGDMITKINGKSAKKYTINQAVRDITGPPGTSVTLTLKRPGKDAEIDIPLVRQEITIFTIKGQRRDDNGHWRYMVDPNQKIAYIRLTNFTEGSIDELKDAVVKLRKEEGMRGLIFDIRANPGGPLKSAVDVADLFLGADKQIVSTKDRKAEAGESKPWSTSSGDDGQELTDFPMILLANRISASASEIVAGALQYHQRALVVGERTFGKGSVQQVLRLNNSNSAFLKLTTAHYYLPDGRCLHRDEDSVTWGVDPDVEVKLVPKEIMKVYNLNVKNDILKGKDQEKLTPEEVNALTDIKPATQPAKGKTEDGEDKEVATSEEGDDAEAEEVEEPARDDANDYPEIDPQLEAAVMLMRVRLESEQPWPTRPAKMAANEAANNGG